MRNHTQICMLIIILSMLRPSLFSIVSTVCGQEERRRICRACLDCPVDYAHEVVGVPDNAVMLNEEFDHCSPDLFYECGTPRRISLFIIIDHSAAMHVNDPHSQRYVAARALIDSLDKYLPEVFTGGRNWSRSLFQQITLPL